MFYVIVVIELYRWFRWLCWRGTEVEITFKYCSCNCYFYCL